jgi:hypothetical protein
LALSFVDRRDTRRRRHARLAPASSKFAIVFAQDNNGEPSAAAPMQTTGVPGEPDRTILPPPESPFKGKIETELTDSTQDWPKSLKAPEGAPNVFLIIGDDVGFGTPSSFGGPVNTPVFDRIAQQGLRYTNFHTTAICAASRAAILTGRNPHSVGFGNIPDCACGFPGYITA